MIVEGRYIALGQEAKEDLIMFFLYKTKGNTICFDIINVERQRNTYDCGVYALAFATELAHGADPTLYC